MSTYRGFGEQALHYFIRPDEGPHADVVEHPAAWRGDELDTERWLVELTDEQIAEIGAAADSVMAAGIELGDVTADSFVLDTVGPLADAWRTELGSGIGVVCLRGLPVREWGEEKSAYAYWGLGHNVGIPGAQNPDGELLGHVIDYGETDDSPMVRMYRTTSDIAFHCDAADVVGLLCMRTAREGGQSRLVSSVRVFNEIVERRPDLVAGLFEEFEVDRRDEQGEGESPTLQVAPCAWDGEMLRTFWHSDYMRSADRHDGVDISPTRLELMDLYDEIANSPGMHTDMWLEEGDLQLISNHTVVHSRTGYVDHDDPADRRHLLRLWLSLS